MTASSAKYESAFIVLTFILPFYSYSQVKISGPACILQGVEYQYLISGNWAGNSTLQACVQGGMLVDSSTCYDGQPVGFIRLVWNAQATNPRLTIHSSIGDTVFIITLTSQLQSGLLDSSARFQLSDMGHIPTAIDCAPATGGNCSPSYAYQWQQSLNNLSWTDINNATGTSLSFTSANSRTMYYRRKVTETVSNSIDYSDVGMIIIQ
jgi:hypothetical protein